MSTSPEILHAYRHLYRALLHAVQFSKPARYVARDQLRNAFRNEDSSSFQKEAVERTVEFLNIAARERGLEHKLLKNLLFTAGTRAALTKKSPISNVNEDRYEILRKSRVHYDMTLAMLNDTMGLCLR